jgi:hypothetical protein
VIVLKEYNIKRHYTTSHALQLSGKHSQMRGKKLSFRTVLLNSKVYSSSTAVCASYMVSEMLQELTEHFNKREITTILKLIYLN